MPFTSVMHSQLLSHYNFFSLNFCLFYFFFYVRNMKWFQIVTVEGTNNKTEKYYLCLLLYNIRKCLFFLFSPKLLDSVWKDTLKAFEEIKGQPNGTAWENYFGYLNIFSFWNYQWIHERHNDIFKVQSL